MVIDISSNHRLLTTSEEPYHTTLSSFSATQSTQSSHQQSPLFPSLTHSTLMNLLAHKPFPTHALPTDPSPRTSSLPSANISPPTMQHHIHIFPPPYHIFHTMKKHHFLATRPPCSLARRAFTCETQNLLILPFLLQQQTAVSISGQSTWSLCLWLPAPSFQKRW